MSNRYANLVPANKIKDEYTKLNTGFDLVQAEIDAEIENRGIDEEAIYETMSGMNDERISADNAMTARINTHVNSTTEKHVSSGIVNDSTVLGASVSSVVQSLQGQISSITSAAANAQIGVYAVSATGTNTLTSTFTGLTYYAGMKMNWSITADNTGAVTMNVNSLGSKNIYKVVQGVKTALSPRDLRIGDIAQAQYDGTDFILLNGNRNEEYSSTVVSTDSVNTLPSTSQGLMGEMVVKGRTYTNLLTDAVAGCESIIGWSISGCTIAVDSSNELEGTNCLKLTANTTGVRYAYRSIFSLLNVTKYYLISGSIKNGNLANSATIAFESNDLAYAQASNISSTSYNRTGLLLSPSDLNTATIATLALYINGNATEYAYFDTLQLIEISATDYALGVPTLLAKYEWHLGTKSVDKMRVLSVGKNLFDRTKLTDWVFGSGLSLATGAIYSDADTCYYSKYIDVSPSTIYTLSHISSIVKFVAFYDSKYSYLSYQDSLANTSLTFTTPSTAKYIRFTLANTGLANVTAISSLNFQLEKSATATTYEPYQQTQSICPLPLRAVPTITDTWDSIRGKHVKNVSDWLSLLGINSNWGLNTDGAGFKSVYTLLNVITPTPVYSKSIYGVDYQGRRTSTIIADSNFADIDENSVRLQIPDSLTGFPESWSGASGFTGLSWTGLIKIYFNGWKLTTANLDVASCVWTGVVSGTTQSGASGAAYVAANADVGYTPYKIIYQLATPITTYLQPNILSASANGTIYQENFIEDYGWYNSGLALTDNTKLITNLVEVRKWNINDGRYTIIPNSSVTLTTGVITAITGAVNGEFYTFDYNYDESLGLNGELNYSYAVNTMSQVKLNSENIITLDKKVNDLAQSNERLSQGYEDLQISISAGKVPVANTPLFETFTANTNEYSFAVNDYIDLAAAEPPHNHQLGQTCSFHLHLTTKAANATGANRYAKFTIYVAYVTIAGVWQQTSITAEATIPTGTLALTNMILLLPGFNLGAVGIGGQIKVRIVRIAATGGTEYASSIFATQLGLHYIADSLGSTTPTTK